MGDKENGMNELVDRGTGGPTALCRHVTAIRYYVIAIYRHLLFFIILASTIITRAEAYLVKTKYF